MAEVRTALGIGTIMIVALAAAPPPARAAEGDWYASLYGGAMFLENANNVGNSNALDFRSVAKTGYDARVAVGVLGEAIDLAVATRRHREMLGREKLGPPGEVDQHRLQGVESGAGHAHLGLDAADLGEGLLDRL